MGYGWSSRDRLAPMRMVECDTDPKYEVVKYHRPSLRRWTRVQAQRAERSQGEMPQVRRPRHLLSGLVKCGRCGSSYIVGGSDRRGSALFCSRHRESGSCSNGRSIAREVLEERVLSGLEKQLAAPDVIAEYLKEFHTAAREQNAQNTVRMRTIKLRLPDVETAMEKTIDQLIYGTATAALRERLGQLEAERDRLKAELETLVPLNVTLHPSAAEDYRTKVRKLRETLTHAIDEEGRAEAFAIIRNLVERIVIHPRAARQPVDIEIHGQLAAFLRISETAQDLTGSTSPLSVGTLVAGTRNSHHHRLPPLIVTVRSR